MKKFLNEEIVNALIFLGVIVIISLFFMSGTVLLVKYCENGAKRNISHYYEEEYYMCDVITGGTKYPQSHYGSIKTSDYKKWENGEISTIWVTSSKDENKGWKLNCNQIITIKIYNRDWLPINF